MKQIDSGKTAISRNRMSAPMRNFLKSYGDKIKNKSILDFGCGKGKDVEEAAKMGYDIVGYDPNQDFPLPDRNFDIVYCGYVINVIRDFDRRLLIKQMWDKLWDGGMLVIVSRTDKEVENNALKGNWGKLDDGFITAKNTFQKGFNRVELSNLCQSVLKGENYIIMTTTHFDCNCSAVIIRKLRD